MTRPSDLRAVPHTPSRSTTLDYRADIDGLRAIAVLTVIFFHAGVPGFKGGFLGVDIFFVISGYLITSIIVAEIAAGRFSIARFYERRARRILPALFVVLLASWPLALATLPPKPLVDFSQSALATLGFVANIYFWSATNYFSEPAELTPLLHTWSLAVEEQFYIVFPLLLLAITGFRNRLLLIAGLTVLSLIAAFGFAHRDPSGVFYLPVFRAWELLAGALVALAQSSGRLRPSAAAVFAGLVAIACVVVLTKTGQALIGALGATAGAVLIIAGGGNHLPSRLLGTPILRGIGLISYSLYLWHQPVFVFARFQSIDTLTLPVYAVLIAVSILLAALTWRFIEMPFRHHVPRPRFLLMTGATAVMLLAAFATGIIMNGWPQRFGKEDLALLSAAPERAVAVQDGRPCRRTLDDACIIGDRSVPPSFAVLGDSHAEALTEPIAALLQQYKRSAYAYTVVACPFALNVLSNGTDSHCADRTAAVFDKLREHGIKSVILNDRIAAYVHGSFDNGEGGREPHHLPLFSPAGFSGTDAERVKAMAVQRKLTIERLLDAGITVYYIAPVPEVGWHVPRTLVKAIARDRLPLTTNLARYFERNGSELELAKALSTRPGFIAIRPHELLCDKDRCHTHRDGRIFYTDYDHLSADGSKPVIEELAKALRQRLGPAP